ncbi:MAG: 16S rRNA (guanine(527)-N(7))-methyltransferase RsmG, partial [Proteobacteria bacterium]|nr:16S rRNA (guanine(527)-N(7))-methyltransferase RsmG [Pseudomonadota bacterium]
MARLGRLADLLVEENTRQNLVARGTLPHVWQRHILDSAQLLACVPRGTMPAGPWLDLGTGAGFPGLAVAALEPDRPVTLVDSRRLRTDWLARAAADLRLANVDVVLSRVEDLPTRQYAVISARAFAPLDKLLHLSARFSTPETLWLLPK